jgi:hypothetical protein
MPSFDMTITREDFARLLPLATASTPLFVDGRWTGTLGDNPSLRWSARLEPLPPLRFGLFQLERHRLQLEIKPPTGPHVQAWLNRFWLHYQRGGG